MERAPEHLSHVPERRSGQQYWRPRDAPAANTSALSQDYPRKKQNPVAATKYRRSVESPSLHRRLKQPGPPPLRRPATRTPSPPTRSHSTRRSVPFPPATMHPRFQSDIFSRPSSPAIPSAKQSL